MNQRILPLKKWVLQLNEHRFYRFCFGFVCSGVVNTFLSWDFFVPLGRLTFLNYLVHYTMITVLNMNSQVQTYATDFYCVSGRMFRLISTIFSFTAVVPNNCFFFADMGNISLGEIVATNNFVLKTSNDGRDDGLCLRHLQKVQVLSSTDSTESVQTWLCWLY